MISNSKIIALLAVAAAAAGCGNATKPFPVEEFEAPEGGKVAITMVNHGSVALSYKGFEIQVDPVGSLQGKEIDYSGFPKADLILVTHDHGDHLNADTVASLSKDDTVVLCNPASHEILPSSQPMKNGETASFKKNITVKAVPAYNISEGHTQFHPKGKGNGYLLNLGGLVIYIAGDTEDIPELSELKDIDIAFLPVNQPYTMTSEQCIRAAKTIAPKVLIPYHLSDTDVAPILSGLFDSKIEVKLYDTLK